MANFQGRNVLVTGGSRGLGKVVIRRFAESGACVFVSCFHGRDDAEAAAADFAAIGVDVHLVDGSVGGLEGARRILDHISASAGSLDVLINNTPTDEVLASGEVSKGDWLLAPQSRTSEIIRFSLQASALMSPGCAVVNLCAPGAARNRHTTAADVDRASLEAATRYLAVELAPLGVQVNCVVCGADTGSAATHVAGLGQPCDTPASTTPASICAMEDCADLALFLASPRARQVTGQTLLVDGGLSLGARLASPPANPQHPPMHSGEVPVGADAGLNAGEAIAIVATGSVLPDARGSQELWDVLTSGDPVFREPDQRWPSTTYYSSDPAAPERYYARKQGFISTKVSDAQRQEDYNTTWLRESLRQAWKHVSVASDDRTAFLVGATSDGSQHLDETFTLAALKHALAGAHAAGEMVSAAQDHLRHATPDPSKCLPHVAAWEAAKSVLPRDCDITVVDTACSSSLYAIDIGMRRLRAGLCDIAVCGGSFALSPRMGVLFAKLKGFSPSGAVRAFDTEADGTLFSDGAGVVVLKTLERARADGDEVLAVLTGIGASCDGRGKAIYAPASKGQIMAVRRAYANGPSAQDVDWLVAHGTGTRAGDQTECATLRAEFSRDRPLAMTSNKSLLGHTAWASGVLSVIHAVQAFRHGTIPGHRPVVRSLRKELPDAVTIPQEPLSWPRLPTGVRTAAVNSFGFGGTNAHAVLVEEHRSLRPHPKTPLDDPIVLVGWHAVLPGAPSQATVSSWLTQGRLQEAPPVFDDIPSVPFRILKVPPASHQSLDPGHRLALLAVDGLYDMLSPWWSRLNDTAGVIGAHYGLTSHSARHTLRCVQDDLRHHVVHKFSDPQLECAYAQFADRALRAVPTATEDSFPGAMPSLLSARVAASLDFHGLSLTCDTGSASGIDALRVACDYLRTGDLDLALVVSVNAHSTGPWAELMLPALGKNIDELGEGAICMALTRESHAVRAGLDVHAVLSTESSGDKTTVVNVPGRRSYMAADSALAVLTHVVSRRQGSLSWTDPLTDRTATLTVDPPSTTLTDPSPPSPPVVDSYGIEYRPMPALPAEQPIGLLPDYCIVVTNEPDALAGQTLPPHILTISTTDVQQVRGVHAVTDPVEESITRLVKESGWRPRHVRVVVNAGGPGPQPPTRHLLVVHDLAFLAIKACFEDLPRGSFAILVYNAIDHGLPTAEAGLFTGLVKSVRCDLPQTAAFCVLSHADSVEAALQHLGSELRNRSITRIVTLTQTGRCEPLPFPLPATISTRRTPAALNNASIVVAAGGSRGITAAVLKDLAATVQPKIWILGRTTITGTPAIPDDMTRSDYLSLRSSDAPPTSVATANREYDRLLAQRETRETLAVLARHCGTDRVIYLPCDVRDQDAVEQAIRRIRADDPVIDLLIFAAGANRAAETPNKSLDDFRAVRDIKVRGHANLLHALADGQPRTWINFGSIAAFLGQPGDPDYVSANDYLATVGQQSHHAGNDHFTLAWPLWKETGLASDPFMQKQLARMGHDGITTTEGIELFRHALDNPPQPPYTLLLRPGDMERLADRRFPGIKAASEHQPPPATPAPPLHPLLDTVPPTEGSFSCGLDIRSHSYLTDHLVDGRPTMPGTFLVELAVEAAGAVRPDRIPARIVDGSFENFLRTHPRRGTATVEITTRIEYSDDFETRVAVSFHGEVRSPKGIVLRPRYLHARCTVILAETLPSAPAEPIVIPTRARPLPDPYYLSNGSITLRGVFITTSESTSCEGTSYSRFTPTDHIHDEPFASFRTPALLADALARTAALNGRSGTVIPVFALRSFREIAFHRAGADKDVIQGTDTITLTAAPDRDGDPHGPAGHRCTAVDSAGAVILTIRGLTGYEKGAARLNYR